MIEALNKSGYVFVPSMIGDKPHVYKRIGTRDMSFVHVDGQIIPYSSQPVFFSKAGITTTGFDFYREYFNMTDDEFLLMTVGYGKRTQSYLSAIINNIGLVNVTEAANSSGTADGECESTIPMTDIASLRINASMRSGSMPDGTVLIEIVWLDGDDYLVCKMYFDHAPSNADIAAALDIRDIKAYFKSSHSSRSEMINDGCGGKTHWLDTNGSLQVRLDNLKYSCSDF